MVKLQQHCARIQRGRSVPFEGEDEKTHRQARLQILKFVQLITCIYRFVLQHFN
jgi:hypothetical protein